MLRLWKLVGVIAFGVLLAFSAVAAYDAFSAHGVSRLKQEKAELQDSIATHKANARLADEQARRQQDYVIALNAVIDQQREELRPLEAFADSVRDAARPARAHTHVVRGVDVDTLFIATRPHLVEKPVADHVELLEGVIVADSLELARLRPYVVNLERQRDSMASLDTTRLRQLAERDRTIELGDLALAKADSIIAKQNPRCGRKCGVAIGATGTLIVIRVVTWIVESVRPR